MAIMDAVGLNFNHENYKPVVSTVHLESI